MAPRGGNRVRIVSPNSGSVCYSRSVSRSQQYAGDSDDYCASQEYQLHRSASVNSSSILKKHSSFGRADAVRTPLSVLPHNQSASRAASAKSVSRSRSAPARSAAAIEAAYAHHVAPPSRRRPRSVQEEEDDERAIERAQEALNAAASHVLRRPFGQLKNAAPVAAPLSVPPPLPTGAPARSASRTATDKSAAKTSMTTTTATTTGKATGTSRSLNVPRTIPITRSRSSHASSADFRDLLDGDDVAEFEPLKRRRREERKPDMPAYMAALLPPPRAPAPAKAAAAAPTARAPASAAEAAPPTRLPRGPCPGMFRGLSSIVVSEQLFAGAFELRDVDDDAASYATRHASGASGASGASSSSSAAAARASAVLMRRCCRPLWCLVGTFKTGLSSVVSVDPTHDRVHWQQRNPRGGFQSIHVPLSGVLDAFVARVTQEDEDIQERQFTVVIRTSTRPSQVVFGFRTITEANQFLKMVAPQKPAA